MEVFVQPLLLIRILWVRSSNHLLYTLLFRYLQDRSLPEARQVVTESLIPVKDAQVIQHNGHFCMYALCIQSTALN